jgi:hypothetical protein
VFNFFTVPKILTEVKSMKDTNAGWIKYEKNPVFGGDLGTCFDVSLLRENRKFRMWFSWRPQKSIALTESLDGINWNDPVFVLRPNDGTDWENDINRPAVVRRDDSYYMWYTGQANGHSWLGYAKSNDGIAWKRISSKPVLSSEESWEKVAVMCPHVIWSEELKVGSRMSQTLSATPQVLMGSIGQNLKKIQYFPLILIIHGNSTRLLPVRLYSMTDGI